MKSYLVFLKHHEVEVTDALFCVLPHSFEEGWLADDVANILVDECIPILSVSADRVDGQSVQHLLRNVFPCSEAKTFHLRLDNLYRSILFALEAVNRSGMHQTRQLVSVPLVSAVRATSTVFRKAFHLGESIDTVGIMAAGSVRVVNA